MWFACTLWQSCFVCFVGSQGWDRPTAWLNNCAFLARSMKRHATFSHAWWGESCTCQSSNQCEMLFQIILRWEFRCMNCTMEMHMLSTTQCHSAAANDRLKQPPIKSNLRTAATEPMQQFVDHKMNACKFHFEHRQLALTITSTSWVDDLLTKFLCHLWRLDRRAAGPNRLPRIETCLNGSLA